MTSFKVFKKEPLSEDSQRQTFHEKCNYETCQEAQPHSTTFIDRHFMKKPTTEKQQESSQEHESDIIKPVRVLRGL